MPHSIPPSPSSDCDARWREQRRRRRKLEGLWIEDLREALRAEVGRDRYYTWGQTPDLTKNTFRTVVSQLSVMYDVAPVILHTDGEGMRAMRAAVNAAGLWQLAQYNQRLTVGLRESFIKASVVSPPGQPPQLQYRVVPADLIEAFAHPDTPDTPHTVYEYRRRRGLKGEPIWTRDCWSVLDLGQPSFAIQSADGKADLTDAYPGTDVTFPRRADGMPVLPYQIYHALRSSKLWDPWFGVELVEGSLKVAVLWTFWSHVVHDASWPQRYGANVRLRGGAPGAEDLGPRYVPTDPASLLLLEQDNPNVAAQIGQWTAGGDPVALGEAIRAYASDLATDYDITPGDIARATGDARSGFAIWLTQDGKRSAQRRYAPQARRADVGLLSRTAATWNSHPATQGLVRLPEDGWDIEYQGVPLSVDERRAKLAELERMEQIGIISKVDIRARTFGETPDQAQLQLARIATESKPSSAPVAESALNGAQVTAAVTILQTVAEGSISDNQAVHMLINFFRLSRDVAVSIVQGASPPPPTPQPDEPPPIDTTQ